MCVRTSSFFLLFCFSATELVRPYVTQAIAFVEENSARTEGPRRHTALDLQASARCPMPRPNTPGATVLAEVSAVIELTPLPGNSFSIVLELPLYPGQEATQFLDLGLQPVPVRLDNP